MRTLVVLTVICVYVQALYEPKDMEKVIQICVEEENVEKDKIIDIFKNDVVPEDNPELTAFTSCYCKNMGTLNADGTLNDSRIKELLPQQIRILYSGTEDPDKIADGVYEDCKNIQNESTGVSCLKFRNCVMKYLKNIT